MTRVETIVVGGGVGAGSPFTVNLIPVIVSADPPLIADSILRQVTSGSVTAVIVGATDPAPTANETWRTTGGLISEAPGGITGSFVAGRGATANSTNNVAIGFNANAASTGCVAIGSQATTSGNNSTVVGVLATANGGGGVGGACAFGNGAAATATGAVAVGLNAQASQAGCIAVGRDAIANALPAVVIGTSATANGFRSIIVSGAALSARDHEQIWIHAGGAGPTTTGATGGTIFLGGDNGAGVSVTHANNIIIGMKTSSFTANCVQLGGPGTPINTCVIGAGNTATGQTPLTLRLTDRTGAGNLPGSNLTIRPGAGVGNDLTAGSILLQTPVSAVAGVTQGFALRASFPAGGGLVLEAPDAGGPSLRFNGLVNGAGAAIGSLNNAPVAGNPSFWLPVNIAGTVRFIPCW
jgi:hypothetical protein